jgi:TonB family protein
MHVSRFTLVMLLALTSGISGSAVAAAQTPPSSAPAQAPAATGLAAPNSSATALKPKKIVYALYPPVAREKGLQGEVVEAVLISETGRVESTKLIQGDPMLAAAATEAIEEWEFEPTLQDGSPIAVIARASFNFSSDAEHGKIAPRIDMPAAFPQRVKVSEETISKFVLKRTNPDYPPFARDSKITGNVSLEVVIDKNGKPSDVHVLSGDATLAAAAVEAVRKWQFRPYLVMQRPVEVETQLIVKFSIFE